MLASRLRSIVNVKTTHFVNHTFRATSASFSTPSEPKLAKEKKMSFVKICMELSKFRLSSMVAFTGGAGFICAGVTPFDVPMLASVCIGTVLCASSAGTFNQVFEIDRDRAMKRTCHRPLPSGAISKNEAIGFGALTGIGGTALLLVGTNPVVAALGAFNIALYAGAYTYSKKHTELNTWIGAVVGAIPPVMGWAAATGGSIYALEPLALATLMFLWQFPHFFALSWMYREDYARGQFQMVAVNDPLGTRSARLITEYSMYLAAFPFVTCALDLTSQMFMVEGVVINGGLLYLAHKFKQDRSNKNANNVFKYSLFYIMSMMGLYVFHSRMWDEKKLENEEQDGITTSFQVAKDTMKGLCPHETLSHSEGGDSSHLCAKKAVDKAVNEVEEVVGSTTVMIGEPTIETKQE